MTEREIFLGRQIRLGYYRGDPVTIEIAGGKARLRINKLYQTWTFPWQRHEDWMIPYYHSNKEAFMKFVKKNDAHPSAAGAGSLSLADCPVLGGLEAVTEYLTCVKYPDGSPREKSSLVIVVDDQVRVCLSDKDQGLTLWRAGRTLQDALIALELAIVEGKADWRKAKQYDPKKRK